MIRFPDRIYYKHEKGAMPVPLYDYRCVTCGAGCEVILDSAGQKEMELICVDCGGVMKAAAVSTFTLRSANPSAPAPKKPDLKAGSCGHGHHCRCAIKSKHPNPFQEQIDRILNGTGSK